MQQKFIDILSTNNYDNIDTYVKNSINENEANRDILLPLLNDDDMEYDTEDILATPWGIVAMKDDIDLCYLLKFKFPNLTTNLIDMPIYNLLDKLVESKKFNTLSWLYLNYNHIKHIQDNFQRIFITAIFKNQYDLATKIFYICDKLWILKKTISAIFYDGNVSGDILDFLVILIKQSNFCIKDFDLTQEADCIALNCMSAIIISRIKVNN